MSVNGQLLPLDRATVYFERAKQLSLFSSGTSLELERLLREIYKALSYENEEIKFYLLLGKIYKLNLDITSSMFCYRFILKQNSSMIAARKFLIELLVLKGKEYMIMGLDLRWKSKFTSARSCFDEALEYNRENLDLWILKSICHVHCHELVEAFEAISKVIKPNRELPAEVYILRAKINWGRGLTEQGNQDIRFAASLDSNHPEVLGFIARSYAKSELLYQEALLAFTMEKYKEALELVNHALHITAEDIKLYILKSRIFRMLKELQSAYEAIMKAKSIFEEKYEIEQYAMQLPPEIMIQTNLILNEMAINYALEGNYQNAILLYNKILRSEETLNATLVSLPAPCTMSGDGQKSSPGSPSNKGNSSSNNQTSILFKTRIPQSHYINYKYYMNRGDCYRALHSYNEAILDYQTALTIESSDWNIKTKLSLTHYLIASNHFNDSAFLNADIELTKAISYNPKVSEYYSLRGKAKYYLSDFLGSHNDYKKVIELDPNNNEIKMRLQQFEDDIPSSSSSSMKGVGGLSVDTSQQKGNASLRTRSAELARKEKEHQERVYSLVETMSNYKTERKVQQLHPDTNDYLEMMLSKSVKRSKLPTLKLITTEWEEEQARKTSSKKLLDQRLTSKENAPVVVGISKDTNEEILLPKILTKSQFLSAHIAKVDVTKKNHHIQKELYEKREECIARGELWKIVDTAKEIALSKTQAKLKDHLAKLQKVSVAKSRKNKVES
jgi:tetratricopeptide (TPR) repeat protein